MDDLRQRFATLDRVPVPDVWSDVERRLEALGPAASTQRLAAVTRERRRALSVPSSGAGNALGDRRTVWILVAAALIATVLIGGALAVGSGLLRFSTVLPSPDASIVIGPSPSPRATPTPAPRAASWSVTGSMITARSESTATLLANGKVLVVGGTSADSRGLAAVELYDPATGQWGTTGSLTTLRWRHTATLLADGRVLVAGGVGGPPRGGAATTLASAELYDPGTGKWSTSGSMVTARWGHTATLLADGGVLVAGGSAGNDGSAELYDPRTGTWSTSGGMLTARLGHTATLLDDGRVLVLGMSPKDGSTVSSELYDPRAGTWSATGSMNQDQARANHTATVLADGRVLVAGGWAAGPVLASSELYDSRTGIWSATGSMAHPSENHTAMLLADGTVLVINNGAEAALYDPRTGEWSAWSVAGTGNAYRDHPAVTLLADGNVLVAGGADNFGRRLASAELYDPGRAP